MVSLNQTCPLKDTPYALESASGKHRWPRWPVATLPNDVPSSISGSMSWWRSRGSDLGIHEINGNVGRYQKNQANLMIIFFKSPYLFEKKKERQVEVKTEQRVAMKTLRGDCCFRITREVHHFFSRRLISWKLICLAWVPHKLWQKHSSIIHYLQF